MGLADGIAWEREHGLETIKWNNPEKLTEERKENTAMSDDIECPYCGEGMEICNDDGHGTDESETHHEECPHCEKSFSFTTCISFSYTASKADCLNGADHDWKDVTYAPRGLFIKYKRCSDCGAEDKQLNPDFKLQS